MLSFFNPLPRKCDLLICLSPDYQREIFRSVSWMAHLWCLALCTGVNVNALLQRSLRLHLFFHPWKSQPPPTKVYNMLLWALCTVRLQLLLIALPLSSLSVLAPPDFPSMFLNSEINLSHGISGHIILYFTQHLLEWRVSVYVSSLCHFDWK